MSCCRALMGVKVGVAAAATGVAHKFFHVHIVPCCNRYDLVSLASEEESRVAMADIADAVSNCVFVATDVASDDVVFFR